MSSRSQDKDQDQKAARKQKGPFRANSQHIEQGIQAQSKAAINKLMPYMARGNRVKIIEPQYHIK